MEEHFKQGRAYTLSLFAYLETQGISFSESEREKVIGESWSAFAGHLRALRVRPRSIDGFKVIAFVGFGILCDLIDKEEEGEELHISPLRICATLIVRRMASLLRLDTSSGTQMDETHIGYLAEMLLYEISGQEQVGIGPNGLAAVFSMLSRYGNHTPDLAKL